MDPDATQPRRRDDAVSSLNVAVEAMNLAKELSTILPAKDVFGSVRVTLKILRVGPFRFVLIDCRLNLCTQDSMVNEVDYVELGLACADVCTALDRGLNGRLLKDLNNSVRGAIARLAT